MIMPDAENKFKFSNECHCISPGNMNIMQFISRLSTFNLRFFYDCRKTQLQEVLNLSIRPLSC